MGINSNVITSPDYQDMFKEFPDVMNVKQVKQALGVGFNTAYKLVGENKIKHFRIGKEFKIPKAYLIDFVFSQQH